MKRLLATSMAMSFLAFSAVFTGAGQSALADDISDALAEAQKAYADGDVAASRQAVDVAAQLLAQHSADKLVQFLPATPAGWTEEETRSDAAAAAMFGGGLIARRDYRKGDEDVRVLIIAGSPMVAQMAPMFANAQMLGAMGRVFRFQGRTAVMTREGAIQLMGGDAYITIEGSASEADKRMFLEAIDLDSVEKAMR
ncbi:hypothetical protein ACT6QH_02645 [Xanthobacter sp. TB0139]|uniref:hypothetical protein n=1 Tax=Xanthobacter sp. TB0139 TaxID=3459178 RepID=UPI004039CC4C